MNDGSVGVALVLVAGIGFGTLGVLGKIAAGAGLSIPTVLFFRFALATAILWPILRIRGRFRLLSGRRLALAVALGGLAYATMTGLYFLGLEYMTAGLVAVVLFTYPAFVVCFTAISRPDSVTAPLSIALVLALSGVALITGADPAGADPRGVLVVLGAAVTNAGYILASQRLLETVDAETLAAFVMPAAALSFLGFGVGTGSISVPDGAVAWLVVVGLAVIATVIPMLAVFEGIARIGASRASIVSTVEPAVAIALGAALLAEPVTAVTLVGAALVVAGVILIEREGVVAR